MNPVLRYHEGSKHHFDRYAPGPGRLDWATQPEPFRRYTGAPLVDLPLLGGELPARWDDLLRPGAVPAQAIELDTLAHLLELSLGIAAWKSHGGSRWALRCNPSSGNLHPTEAYLVAPNLPGLAAGVYHYRAEDHRLERRATAPFAWSGGVLVALTGIHWREAWKYGVRAFRYCQHDCGHALAALSYASAALGWSVRLLSGWGDALIARLTGIDRAADFEGAEQEAPEALVWIGPGEAPDVAALTDGLRRAAWQGRANRLSVGHRDWPEIEAVAAATRWPADAPLRGRALLRLPPPASGSGEPVSRLIRRRRSAQAFDGVSGIGATSFFRMLDALLPRAGHPPWTLVETVPAVHPVLFVHRVAGVDPGVYCLARDSDQLGLLKEELRRDWLWAPVPGCPVHLPLYLLAPQDVRDFAVAVSCHQDIAGDSAFSLAMLARFDDISVECPWLYRHRFWEAGILGQALYLEAEGGGVQGTGIGCYFDDAVHQALGLAGTRFQDLYHFTVGTAVTDERLVSELPYAHLADRPVRTLPRGNG